MEQRGRRSDCGRGKWERATAECFEDEVSHENDQDMSEQSLTWQDVLGTRAGSFDVTVAELVV